MSTAERVSVRESVASDRAAILELVRERDEREHAEGDVLSAFFGLDPARFRAWLAFAGEKPVGITALYVRDVVWQGAPKRAGYWAHLYVRPDYRKLMIYPNLVLSMMRGSKAVGPGGGAAMDFLYTGTRRPDVAEAHVRIGFGLCGFLTVRVKPLRPARLVAKHKGFGKLATAGAPVDAVYRAGLALARRGPGAGVTVEPFELDDAGAATLARLLNEGRGARFAQAWTAEALRRRFSGAIDGERYSFLAARRGQEALGAVVFRMAERGAGIRVGVIMNVVGSAGGEGAARALLGAAERAILERGGEVAIALDGDGDAGSETLRRAGYRTSGERYQMTVWPKDVCAPGSWTTDLGNWRFTFLDHDAF